MLNGQSFAVPGPIFWIAVGILAAYTVALCGLLRRESRRTWVGLLVLVGLVSVSRLVWYESYPPGSHEDEPKLAICSYQQWKGGVWRPEGCTGLPALLWVAFRAPLLEWFGPNLWALRAYSIVTGVAAVPVAFALARRVGIGVDGGFAFASLIGFLPWSLFYGRVNFGGELIFHQMLLLCGLAALVFRRGSLPFGLFLGALGQGLLLYDYFAGRFFAPFALVSAVLATGWVRVFCLLVPLLSLVGWIPYLTARPVYVLGPLGVGASPLDVLLQLPQRLWSVLKLFLFPICTEATAISLRAAAVHPELVLALALLGVALGYRRERKLAAFLVGGFPVGILPGLVTAHQCVSSHRILMSSPFVALAAVSALQSLTVPAARRLALLALGVVASGQSVCFFFSPRFWYDSSRGHYGWETTAAMSALLYPIPGKAFLARQLSYWGLFWSVFDPNVHFLSMADWIPQPNGLTFYAFSAHSETAKEFYKEWVGPERVREAGRAFTVQMEPGDVVAVAGRGWSFSASCGSQAVFFEVPHVFQPQAELPFRHCMAEHVQLWRGKWRGPRASLRVDVVDSLAWVRVGEKVLAQQRPGLSGIPFEVEPGDVVEVGIRHPPAAVWLALQQVQGSTVRLAPFAPVEPALRCEDPWLAVPVRSGWG